MKVLGFESSCDETGVALVEVTQVGAPRLLAQALHSQISMHQAYGGVVPELASRDHIRRVLPLTREVLAEAGLALAEVDVIAYTQGPGLAGALLVGAGVAVALAAALNKPTLGVHHLEGHLLSPFLSNDAPEFPFVALLVSGGHTQLMRVDRGRPVRDARRDHRRRRRRSLRQERQAAWVCLIPVARIWRSWPSRATPSAFELPRPMLHSGKPDFSFAGLKTAVLTQVKKLGERLTDQQRADLAASTQAAIVEVLVKKSLLALEGDRAEAAGRGRRRRGQQPAAPATECCLCEAPGAGALPRAEPVHRQRRDDRDGRRDAAAAWHGDVAAGRRLCEVRPRWALLVADQLTVSSPALSRWRLTRVRVNTPFSSLAVESACFTSCGNARLREKRVAERSRCSARSPSAAQRPWPARHRR